MVSSCRDPYYLQLVLEYLTHMDLPETAALFKKECYFKKYQLDEELVFSDQNTTVPKLILYLTIALNGNGNIPKTNISEYLNCYFSHEESHDIHIIQSKFEDNKSTRQKWLLLDSESACNTQTFVRVEKNFQDDKHSLQLKPRRSVGREPTMPEKANKSYSLDYSLLKKKFNKLHSDYHNLIGVASELTGALEMSARGEQIDLRDTLKNCVQIYPELFSYQKVISKESIKGRFSVKSIHCEWNLHIPRIREHLMEGSVKQRLLLLQALRWVITKSSYQKRECIMNQYVGWDLLNLQDASLLKTLLIPHGVVTPHPLQQSAARLLNAIASVQSGRSYLAQNSETIMVIAAVLQQLDGISSDSTTQNMLLAALQKLSLRRSQRVAMIQAGMVEWLFQQFSNFNVKSSYSIEYGTALLMNLCLHQSARQLCIPMAQNVLTILIRLLSTAVTQALAYINGTIYSLITHPTLNEAALAVGLQDALEYNIKNQSDVGIKRQMEHILQFHKTLLQCSNFTPANFPISEGEMIDEDNEELNLLGEELDEGDPVRSINGELCGEDLLQACYTIAENSAETTQSDSDPSESHGSSSMFRPTTPQHLSQNISQHIAEKGEKDKNSKTEILDMSHWHRRKLISEEQVETHEKNYNKCFSSETDSHDENKVENTTSQEAAWQHIKGEKYETTSSNEPLNFPTDSPKRDIPLISIHLVDNKDNSVNYCDVDEDSEDVQVAFMNPGLQKEQCGNDFFSNIENGDTAPAFTSRPKIPRTPPHLS